MFRKLWLGLGWNFLVLDEVECPLDLAVDWSMVFIDKDGPFDSAGNLLLFIDEDCPLDSGFDGLSVFVEVVGADTGRMGSVSLALAT